MREVADGRLLQDPARHASWLKADADQVIEAVTATGSDLVWTASVGQLLGAPPAHKAAVHIAALSSPSSPGR